MAGLAIAGDSPLLERDRELGVLDGVVQDTLDGRPAVALVEGPAGIGKTRLLWEAREKVSAAGFRVLTARGSDLERELPFGVVRQLFEPALVDPDERARWLTGSAAAAGRVFEPPEEGQAAGDVSFGILYGLFWLTANIAAEEPLLLAIDDLHWCDRGSLRFIAHLGRRLEGLRVLVATAARTGEPHGDQSRLIGEIAHDPAAVSIRLPALSEAAAGELVRERLGAAAEQPFCAACHRATGGNPLLLRELLKALQAEGVSPDAAHADVIRDIGPRAVSHTVLLRLARLPRDAVAVASAVAVLGDGAGLPAAAALARLDEHRVADAAGALARAEILRSEPPLGFVHPLVRDVVYHQLSPSERELRHEHAAKVLTGLGAAPELVAAHLLAVPSRAEPSVAALLREAGLAAGRRGDSEGEVSYLRRALEEPVPVAQRPQLLLELGLAEAGADAPAAAEHLSEAYERLVDPQQRALAARALALMLLFTNSAQEAAAVTRRAVADLPAGYVDARQVLEAFELYAVAFGAEVPDAASRLASVRAGGVAEGLGGSMLRAVAAWDWALRGGSAEQCAELALAALADGTLIAVDPGFMAGVAASVLVLADRDEAVSVAAAAMASAQRRGSLREVCLVNIQRGWNWLQRGELAEAERSLGEAFEQMPLLEENGAGMAYIAAFLTRVRLERGDVDGARAMLANRGSPSPGSDPDTLTRRSGIELLLAEQRWEEARAEADEYHALLSVDNVAWAPWRSLKALALAGLERTDEAIDLLEDELEVARRWGAPGSVGRTLRMLGTVRREQGLDLLREAVDVTDGPTTRLAHAKALTALGAALRRARRPSDAREPLRLGFELASRCGAEALGEQARTELYASGGRPRREALSGPDSLTPSERRVAELAAEGQSNRDIAQALYVTPKTVEFHLTGAYRKLGITARAALAAALAGPRLE